MKSIAILVHFPKKDVERIDRLVKEGFYASRTEAIRDAVRQRITELEREESDFKTMAEEKLEKMFKEYIEEDPHERLRKLGL
jgi:Arc/MetJ-type ribon-helix-helix transcriptional regulator